jgi:hypothetical protein
MKHFLAYWVTGWRSLAQSMLMLLCIYVGLRILMTFERLAALEQTVVAGDFKSTLWISAYLVYLMIFCPFLIGKIFRPKAADNPNSSN